MLKSEEKSGFLKVNFNKKRWNYQNQTHKIYLNEKNVNGINENINELVFENVFANRKNGNKWTKLEMVYYYLND